MAQAYPRPQQGQGISREVGGAPVTGGVWEHPESGNSAITLDDPLFGNAQSQAFSRLGFVWKRAAAPEEIKTMPQLAFDTREGDEERFKGLSARLDKLQDAHDENVSLKAEVEALRKEKAARDEKDRAATAKEQGKAAEKAKKEAEAAAKKAKTSKGSKSGSKAEPKIQGGEGHADPAVESGDRAKVDAARVVADRQGEGTAPESGNAAAPGDRQDVQSDNPTNPQ